MFKLYITIGLVGIQLLGTIANPVPDDSVQFVNLPIRDRLPVDDELLWNEDEENEVDTDYAIIAMDPRTKPPNEFVDSVLDTLRTILELDGNEIPLPRSSQRFERTIWGYTMHAHAIFYNEKVKGLQSVNRSGEATIDRNLGPLWVFDIKLKDVEFNYGFSFKFMGIGPTGHMKGTLESITIGLELKMSSNGTLAVQDFDVKDIGDFRVETSGLGDLNYFVNQIGNTIGGIGKGILLESLEDKMKELMNEALLAKVSVVP